MTLNEAIAIRINVLLKEKSMTQYQLFLNSGVPPQSISDIRHQKNKTNAVNIIYNIARGFNMPLNKFFDGPLFTLENITD